MKLTVMTSTVFREKTQALIIPHFEQERLSGTPHLAKLLASISPTEFSGKEKQVLTLHTTGRLPASRVVYVGLGMRQNLTLEGLRRAVGCAARRVREMGQDRVAIDLSSLTRLAAAGASRQAGSPTDALHAAVEAVVLGNYRFDRFKSSPADQATAIRSLTLCVATGTNRARARAIARRALLVADATNYARGIANLPGNVVWPAVLATHARRLARACHLRCTVLDPSALTRRGFGGLLAVGGGSRNGPRLIVLEHVGPGAARQKPIALVGKAITFDSGGISIKPSEKMDEMKFDKSGGLAVLGALRAAAALRVPRRVLGIIAAAENLPSHTSYRPGDIISSYAGPDQRGVTIEVLNTDAEGRIVLGDAIAYARERGARAIIDLATLTGACVVALGSFAAGLLGNNDALQEQIRAAGERTGERVWPLPLWPEYRDRIKSDVADIKNTAGREGGAITGAAFLAAYAADTPWAHIDIAGTAWTTTAQPYLNKGASGFGVRLLADLLEHWR
ncbi:leucyl aminopeptidase [bacterium]|nr:leucyl aminopeptidase [bacterium]